MTNHTGNGWFAKGHNVRKPIVHGHAPKTGVSRTYQAWAEMRKRCLNPRFRQYADYGGRGITICERWSQFANFLADMGESPPALTLERRDNNGNYEPGNCYWATRKEQSTNRRNTVWITLPDGEKVSAAEAARRLGIKRSTLRFRMRNCPISEWFIPARTPSESATCRLPQGEHDAAR